MTFDPFLPATGMFIGECNPCPASPWNEGLLSDVVTGGEGEGGRMGEELGEHGVVDEGRMVEKEGVTCEGVADGSKGGGVGGGVFRSSP